MGVVKITYLTDGENGDYGGLYIDGVLVADMQAYEFDPVRVIQILIDNHLLENVKVEEGAIEFEDSIKFPDILP